MRPTVSRRDSGEDDAKEHGSTLITVNPAPTPLAAKADMWVKPRPGSDLALALAMVHVIIAEDLYDKRFVTGWTLGFDKLASHVRQYSPDWAAAVPWVPAEQIVALARLVARNIPAVIYSGNGQDNNVNNYQFNRAAAILRAIIRSLDVPGGEIDWTPPPVEPGGSARLHLRDLVPLEKRYARAGAEEELLPNYFSALPQKLVKAMLTSDPYPVRVAFIQGGSFLHTYANAREVRAALEEFPLVLTNSKVPGYIHSGGRQIPSLRNTHPDPCVTISSETAAHHGIGPGDWVAISTKRGRICQRAVLNDEVDPPVVIAEHGWYFPEETADLHGWARANLNILTSNDPPYARELGSATLRGIVCRIAKDDERLPPSEPAPRYRPSHNE